MTRVCCWPRLKLAQHMNTRYATFGVSCDGRSGRPWRAKRSTAIWRRRPPAVNLFATGGILGYQATWDSPADADYLLTIIEDRLTSGASFVERGRSAGDFFNRFGLLSEREYEVRVRHMDRSLNLGGYSSAEAVTTLRSPGEGLDGV